MIYSSTFEDTKYIATGVTSLDYLIYDGNDSLLYAGKAVARPSMASCEINVSRIVQNYLDSELPSEAFSGNTFNEGQFIEPNAVMDFTLTDGKGNVLETYKFLNCWDYKTPFRFIANPGTSYPLSHPANQHYNPSMFIFNSTLNKQNKVKTNIISGEIGDYCGYGALYYSNAIGGWDSFLLETPITVKNSYERYTIGNKWTTYTLQSGTRTLNNTIIETFEIKTHLLTDDESKVLTEQLMPSNNIYLHLFDEDRILPVSITDTPTTLQTRLNQKRKMYYKTINLESNQPKQRI